MKKNKKLKLDTSNARPTTKNNKASPVAEPKLYTPVKSVLSSEFYLYYFQFCFRHFRNALMTDI